MRGDYRASVEAFRQAATEFGKSKISIKDRLPQHDRPEERLMLENLADSAKDSFCMARINLEQAMMGEAQEDHQKSFEEFGLASEKFREVSTLSESEEDRREARFLSTLCEAWQLASKAELQGSNELLQKAVFLFEKAKTLSPNERSLKLASGHRAFCEGLISSRKFADTLDAAFHDEASRQLQLAGEYYFNAGFKTAGYHARARRLLLNASLLLSNKEDESKRDELYQLASTLLRESSDEFRKARQPMKRKQAQGMLEETRIGSKVPFHLAETLRAVAYPSSNAAIYTSAHGVESAVGIERFEHPDIEVTLGNVTTGVGSGGDIGFEIAISNIGRGSVRLLRLDEVVPDGAELVGVPEPWRQRDRSLTHGTLMIAPSKTEKLRLIVRPRGEGLLRIRPRIAFADDNGLNRERLANARLVPTSRIIEFLAASFVSDNASRLRLELCGWRSMMEIAKESKIPRSHVYGEPRYGRAFGKQLDFLVKSSLVEYRVFPRERGRGGNITRVRIQLDNEDVREYVEELTSENIHPKPPMGG
jgi:tetratricopeptide (TPR) repeat protein